MLQELAIQELQYVDLDNGARETVFFFMLNAYLNSRIDTANESDGDEEVNVYLAHLMKSLVDGSFYIEHGNNLATTPLDVFQKVETENSDRGKLNIYRTNADHRLIAFGLFSGWGGHRSLYRQVTTPTQSYLEEAQRFYSWGSLFANRIPRISRGLAVTLEKIAAEFATYLHILSYMGANYMHLLEQLTPGEMFHLEREAHEAALPKVAEHALDRLLDAYNAWKSHPCAETRLRIQEECSRYSEVNAAFEPELIFN